MQCLAASPPPDPIHAVAISNPARGFDVANFMQRAYSFAAFISFAAPGGTNKSSATDIKKEYFLIMTTIIRAIGKKSLFCFGPGYSVKVIARALIDQNWTVFGTFRKKDDARALAALGIEPVPFEDALDKLNAASAILSSIPPNVDGDPVLAHYGGLLRELSDTHWIGYLSTTGVYGDTGGALVDETAPLNPSNDRSHWRAAAEKSWLEISAHVFRLAGIYGPDRSSLSRLKSDLKKRIDYPGHLFSRIHVDDIAQTILASLNHPNPGQIYNLSDDEPVEQQVVEAYAASLLGIDPPPLVAFNEAVKDMSPIAQTFWQDNRRIDNSKIKNEFGIKLIYPSYREGLKAIHQSTENTG
jgi:nucleoside-diphosphate-sugar epimerase